MDCARFEELLFEGLDSSLTASDEDRMRVHAGTCARCRELATLMSDGCASEPAEVPADLVSIVLNRTSGASCGRARLLLAEGIDNALGQDGSLLTIHLETCTDCAAVGRALARMRQELPALAELDPGDAFVAEVMVATVGTATPQRVPLLVRIEEMWERVAARPRLAFEGAYAFAFVAVLVFGLPSQSMADLPARAFNEIQQEGVRIERAVSTGLGELAELGRTTWADSTERAARYFTERPAGDASPLERGLRFWTATAREFATSLWDGIFAPFVESVRALLRAAPADGAEINRNG